MESLITNLKAVKMCLQVCREYQRGNCTRGENDCRFAHPADSTMIDTNDNTVTVCMDYIKGRCTREKCKYFHPPAHLQVKIKATQHQVNQAAAAAAMVGACNRRKREKSIQCLLHSIPSLNIGVQEKSSNIFLKSTLTSVLFPKFLNSKSITSNIGL